MNALISMGMIGNAYAETVSEQIHICDALGTDMPTVFRMRMKQIKIVRGIPVSTKLPETVVTRAKAMSAFDQLRQEAAGVPEMSLDEINEEITAARAERKER